MKRHLAPAMAMIMTTAVLSGCFGSDSDSEALESDARWTPNTVSQETCEDVALGQTRRNRAFLASLGDEFEHTAALGIWKFPVTNGQSLTATMQVPDNKDYQMALFDTNGNKLACSDNSGFGTPESMTYEVNSLTMVWLKVWTSNSPNNSAAIIVVSAPVVSVAAEISEQEPNDTLETAQEIGVAHSIISGALNNSGSQNPADADDFYKYVVAEGEVVSVTATLVSGNDDLIYIQLLDQNEVNLGGANSESYNHFFETNTRTVSFSYNVPASMNELYVWMNALGGSGSYTVEVQIEPAN